MPSDEESVSVEESADASMDLDCLCGDCWLCEMPDEQEARAAVWEWIDFDRLFRAACELSDA